MSQVVYITTEPSEPVHVEGLTQTQPDWTHPHLIEGVDPVRGRQFRATGLIPKGAVLLVDRPYAVIPVVDEPSVSGNLICSNLACNRRLGPTGRYPCPNACVPDVAWCSRSCRDADRTRHDFECTWVKRYAESIRAKWGEYNFGMLWVIVRLLATRYISEGQDQSVVGNGIPTRTRGLQLKHGWDGIDSLCGSVDTWSNEQVRSWTTLVRKYLQSSPVLPHGLSTDRVLHLVCQEEANSFGLYPRETGILRSTPSIDRGEQYAAAVYPTAAIANNSCLPNVIHKPDDKGRMVFTAARDIVPAEECCIAYFDLSQYTDLTARREHLRRSFQFVCRCERCVSEEPAETTEWTPMPLMDI